MPDVRAWQHGQFELVNPQLLKMSLDYATTPKTRTDASDFRSNPAYLQKFIISRQDLRKT